MSMLDKNQATSLPTERLIEHFKLYYRNLLQPSNVRIDNIYADNMIFKDPVHEVTGLDQFSSYLDKLCDNLIDCRFEYLDELVGDGIAYIKWNMHYHHPKISSEPITLRGITHLHFDTHITYHEDVFDMGAMLYEHLTVIGPVTRFIKQKMGKS
ncbi:Uncharacterised protein [BD1-7 clade bacterium]|uniref:SnoaL-like domain-containing protein n=1 Tax=BD1-7 clade bacterium TaxID=2029982 RepID=A0A5S9PMB0_9GAMM|nr:Uncharacterised protein [BD1-7 clade bacterium]CAA0105573.1 Uncharacterised protein [BD1-7 clade bacterium]